MNDQAQFDRPLTPLSAYEPDMREGQPKTPMINEIKWFDDLSPVLTSLFLIKEMLDRGTMSVVYGPSNSGKTFFSLDIAYHVAARSTWRGRRISGGTVLYLAAEGGRGINNRISALRLAHSDTRVPLAIRSAGLDLLHPEADVQRVIDLANEIGPVAMIVIDTLSRVLAGGDENGPVDMTAFVGNVDRIRQATGAHIMIVHHTGKDAARGARGHSSLRAATDTEIEISADAGTGMRTATVQKQRDYSGGQEFHFQLESVELGHDQDGDPVRSCIVVDVEQPDASTGRKKISPADQEALRSLDDALQAHGLKRQGPDWPSCQVVSTENWRTHFYKHFDDDEPETKKKAFQRARKRLRDGGHIQFFDDHYWMCFG
ncbi:helicase RepA family protein [Agrobacterium sp. SORGH_AS 787]|uniref:helicase RepA family protein n=1 Tax=Agrobacterium sp. SORGH_AS 787 TaxID=3041775 RepID=UPI002785B34A|nr:hypothetical protein [Rhizobium sp. SORGH_AS_0787]